MRELGAGHDFADELMEWMGQTNFSGGH